MQSKTLLYPIQPPFNPWKKENKNKQKEIATRLNFGIQDNYKVGDKVLYLSFGTTSPTNDDYNVYIISPGIIKNIKQSKIDGVTRYDVEGIDWSSQTSTKNYIKLNE